MRVTKLAAYLGLGITVMAFVGVGMFIARGQSTAEVRPKCAVKAGEKAIAFEAVTVAGTTVRFPDDYKGKVVLLDFWATWCEDCRAELPNVMAAYQKYHANGFEIVGVSLDKTNQSATLQRFVQEHDMTWPEIYDGGYWEAALAVKYGVRSTPCPVLVDGDTGIVLGSGSQVIGPGLTRLLEPALVAKNKK